MLGREKKPKAKYPGTYRTAYKKSLNANILDSDLAGGFSGIDLMPNRTGSEHKYRVLYGIYGRGLPRPV
jgi:hypothetical protein